MDLLFSRYASPFILLDSLIECNRLYDFIATIYERNNDDKEWQLYLSVISTYIFSGKAISYNEFKQLNREPKQDEKMTEDEIGAILKESENILDNFNPNE